MILPVKRAVAAVSVAGALAVGVGVPAASAQQSGLVNVDIYNVLNHNNVQATVPVQVAANVCSTTVAVLSTELSSGPVNCSAGPNQRFTVQGFAV